MASWIPSSIQKRLLRYALSRTGLLDDTAINLDKLDITLGRKNIVELKDVGLNITRISTLAQLPPTLRLETARVLSLRLTVPADIFQSGIVIDVDGVEVSVRLYEDEATTDKEHQSGLRGSASSQSPSHRKTARRIRSPPARMTSRSDAGGYGARIPTAQDLARSFLQEEPAERQELEASVAANVRALEESVTSENSEGADLGTGATLGLPTFLADFLQGVLDRMEINVKNASATLGAEISSDSSASIPLTLRLRVENASLSLADSRPPPDGQETESCTRHLKLNAISFEMLSDPEVFSELSQISPSLSSPGRKLVSRTNTASENSQSIGSVVNLPTSFPSSSARQSNFERVQPESTFPLHRQTSVPTADADRFADAHEDESQSLNDNESDLDIKPGDDNISWGSRRSRTDTASDDLWNSTAGDDDLPDSLLLQSEHIGRAGTSAARSWATSAQRTRRVESPADRGLRGASSWPRVPEIAESSAPQPSPGSWPAVDQSQQSFAETMASGSSQSGGLERDNKRAALEASEIQQPDLYVTASPQADTPPSNDMTQSRIFSHQEAESMYVSAMTHESREEMTMPGAWTSEARETVSPSPSYSRSINQAHEGPPGSSSLTRPDISDERQSAEDQSGADTPRAQSPAPQLERLPNIDDVDQRIVKKLIVVDTVSIILPTNARKIGNGAAEPDVERHVTQGYMTKASATPRDLPGTFSAYSELPSSRTIATSSIVSTGSVLWDPKESSKSREQALSYKVIVGALNLTLDVATAQLLDKFYSTLSRSTLRKESGRSQSTLRSPAAAITAATWVVTLQRIQCGLCDEIGPDSFDSDPSKTSNMIAFDFERCLLQYSDDEKRATVEQFHLLVGDTALLSFEHESASSLSKGARSVPAFELAISTARTDSRRRPITEVDLRGPQLNINLDLHAVDRAFTSFGGLSGVFELGNSMVSESAPLCSPVTAAKPASGVHFERDAIRPTSPEVKLNARFEGLMISLRGGACSLALQTTAIKAVYREQIASATTSQVRLSGPHMSGSTDVNFVDIDTVRLDYQSIPSDKDLERFLALLTPSKDKYDNDDDILIETLIRQRKKGACLRVTVNDLSAKIVNLDSIAQLEALTDELTQLSAVAKYLPADDRPGLLIMVRVKDVEFQAPVNETFGFLQVTFQDLQFAHVGLPALMALSLSNITVCQVDGPKLLHALLPLSGSENLPMVMARMLGGEVEPTVKIKFFNICGEYSVPIVLALMKADHPITTEQLVGDLAKSAVDLAFPPGKEKMSPGSRKTSPNHADKRDKRTRLNVLVRNSALGLTPQKLQSKALLILTDAQLSILLPPAESLKASVELRRAAMFVTDDSGASGDERVATSGRALGNTTTDARIVSSLAKMGYVPVASIMSASVDLHVSESVDGSNTTTKVDVRNQLLLLETCADSTQTLISTLSALAPPSPPDTQPKYLTEPMTLEDMLSSFTGDAVAEPEQLPETLFDASEMQHSGSFPTMSTDVDKEDADDLLAESEMTSSLYGPVSGIIGDPDADDVESSRDFGETAESLLEEDPFEMPDSPNDMAFSDSTLLKDIRQQARPALSNESVFLRHFEIEDLGFDALGPEIQALGTQHRFNAPVSRQRAFGRHGQGSPLPFSLRLRDVHVIWNIYDGYDWQKTRDGFTAAVERVELRAEERLARRRQSRPEPEDEESVIGDFLFNSIYIGVPSNQEAQDIRRQINRHLDDLASETESVPLSGISRPTNYSASARPSKSLARRRLKLERSKTHKIAFELKGVSVDVSTYPPDSAEIQSSVDVRVKSFEIFDNIPTSTWKKFLTLAQSSDGSREVSKPMIHIELCNVKTIQDYAATEIVLHVSVLPLRLHVDQDALDFITRFFEFKDDSTGQIESSGEQPFLQRVEIDTVDLQLDYKPKKVDYVGLRSGHTTEFMNLVILDAANIRLKHAIVYGIRGFEPLHKTLNDVWMPDVRRNQLPTVLAGLAPVRSLVNIGTGVRDVVAIPIREYKKDGRIVRSVQKGAFHFGKTTASELARLGAKVAIGTQNILQGAEGLLSPSTGSPSGQPGTRYRSSPDLGWHDLDEDGDEREQRAISAYADQPLGVLAGLRSARRYLEHDLLTARDALIAVQGEILESDGPGTAAAAVAKHAPTVILRPVIGATRAVSTALLGVGNQIDRGNLARVEDVSTDRAGPLRLEIH